MHITDSSDRIRLARIDYEPASSSVENRNDSRDFMFVLPLRYGRIRLEADNGVLFDGVVKPGTVRLVQPGAVSRMTPRSVFSSAMIFIPGDTFRERAVAHGLAVEDDLCPQLLDVVPSHPAVQRLVPLFDRAPDLPQPQRQMLIEGLASTLMALILDVDLHKQVEISPGFDEAQFERVLRFADARLGEHLDLGDWAQAAGLSVTEFARRFQQHVGIAPYTWFMDRRVDEAKRLMSGGEMPLVEIALDSGFSSQSHFTEAFRRRVGTSPGRWRKAHAAVKR